MSTKNFEYNGIFRNRFDSFLDIESEYFLFADPNSDIGYEF